MNIETSNIDTTRDSELNSALSALIDIIKSPDVFQAAENWNGSSQKAKNAKGIIDTLDARLNGQEEIEQAIKEIAGLVEGYPDEKVLTIEAFAEDYLADNESKGEEVTSVSVNEYISTLLNLLAEHIEEAEIKRFEEGVRAILSKCLDGSAKTHTKVYYLMPVIKERAKNHAEAERLELKACETISKNADLANGELLSQASERAKGNAAAKMFYLDVLGILMDGLSSHAFAEGFVQTFLYMLEPEEAQALGEIDDESSDPSHLIEKIAISNIPDFVESSIEALGNCPCSNEDEVFACETLVANALGIIKMSFLSELTIEKLAEKIPEHVSAVLSDSTDGQSFADGISQVFSGHIDRNLKAQDIINKVTVILNENKESRPLEATQKTFHDESSKRRGVFRQFNEGLQEIIDNELHNTLTARRLLINCRLGVEEEIAESCDQGDALSKEELGQFVLELVSAAANASRKADADRQLH